MNSIFNEIKELVDRDSCLMSEMEHLDDIAAEMRSVQAQDDERAETRKGLQERCDKALEAAQADAVRFVCVAAKHFYHLLQEVSHMECIYARIEEKLAQRMRELKENQNRVNQLLAEYYAFM